MPTLEALQNVLTPLLAAGGGGAAVAFLLFKTLGEKWIDQEVAKALEFQKHEYEVELRNLQRKIDEELSRSGKLQDREFAVLPRAWELLCDAEDALARLVSVFRQFVDVNRLELAELDEFLGRLPFSESAKDKIRGSHDKLEVYKECQFHHELHEVKMTLHAYTSYVRRNSVFLHDDLRVLFEKISEVIWHTIINRQIGEEAKETKWWVEASQRARDEVMPLTQEIQSVVQKALKEGR